MASVPKVDLLNVRQLLKIYTEIKTNLSTVEVRDSVTKALYKIATFLKMAGMYVPRSGTSGSKRSSGACLARKLLFWYNCFSSLHYTLGCIAY